MSGHVWRLVLAAIEVAILSVLIVVPRCANYERVLVGGEVYFTDADCYARMSRVRMCLAHPGLIVRHHDFENFPEGTIPHTTAPLDYLIVALAMALRPLTAQAVDLSGAIVSPVLALVGGWFLWGWARRMKFRFRWPILIIFAASPILVHGTELGRPDHQSLLIVLFLIALCAEWSLAAEPSRRWGIVAGCAWGLSLWVSLYEPLILFAGVLLISLVGAGPPRSRLFVRQRSAGWLCFLGLVALALLVERRFPSFSFVTQPFVRNWTKGIGELQPVPFFDSIWFEWTGYLIVVLPLLVWWQRESLCRDPVSRRRGMLLLGLLGATFLLSMEQARWSYFFVTVFVVALPSWLEAVKSRIALWVVVILSLWPIARSWDGRLWPNEAELSERLAARSEGVGFRELALTISSSGRHAFLAPWWLCPSLAYWSQRPAVAGSSHEGIAGIVDTARFYAATDPEKAREILERRQIEFVVAYDGGRTAESSSQILGQRVSDKALCHVLDRTPASAPAFLVLTTQNSAGKSFKIVNNR